MESRTIFDFLKDIFYNKPKWKDYSDLDKKSFNVFMINRFISMDMEFVSIINYLQKYTLGILKPGEVYTLYSNVFPKIRFFSKYIKNQNKDDEKYSNELVDFFLEKYPWNKVECINNLSMLSANDII